MSAAALPPDPPSRHPSALALHEYQLALLPPREAEAVGRHLSSCDLCRTDAANLANDQRRFEREVFPQTREVIVERRSPRRYWRRLLPALGVAAAAAAAWLLIAPVERQPDLMTKGDTTLSIFVARDAGPTTVDGKTRLHPGDRIRFVLRPAGQRYAVIASLDGAGRTTVYHPYGGKESAELASGPRVEIPGSIVLDESPGPERIFAVLAARPFATTVVVEALQKLAGKGPTALRETNVLPLPVKSSTQQSILFEKSP